MGFAEELYRLRKEAGLSQKELAKEIGVAQASINYWEKNQRTPSISMVTLIADYFHVSIENLLTRNERTQFEEYEQRQREEAAKKAPIAFIIENGKRVEADRPVKFTSSSISRAEADAQEKVHELFDSIFEDAVGGKRESTTVQVHEILTSYNQLNDVGREEAIKRVNELTEIPKYTTPDDPPQT